MAEVERTDYEIVGDEEFQALLEDSDGLDAQDAYAETWQRLELLTAGRAARKRAQRSQETVAKQMGTKQSVVSSLESGKIDPRLGTLQRYGHAIGSPLQVSFGIPDAYDAPETFASETLTRLLTKLTHQSIARQALNAEALIKALQPAPPQWTTRLLKSLQDYGWARLETINDQEFYKLADNAGSLIGLSLHRDRVEGALTNLAVLGDEHISVTSMALTNTSVDAVLDACVKVIGMLRTVSPKPVLGVGVSVAGIVDPHTGEIEYAPSLQSDADAWHGVAFERQLELRAKDQFATDIRVAVENDANSLGLSDYLSTGSESSLIVLLSGVGIGASYVVDGKVIHGGHNGVCELGHSVVRPNGPVCRAGFGHNGCIETVSSAAGMLLEMGIPANTSEDLRRGLAQLNTLAAGGNKRAIDVLYRSGSEIGGVIGDAVRFMDPGRLKVYSHNYLADPKRFASAQRFQEGFNSEFEKTCAQRLDFLPSITPEWGEISGGTRARAAARAALWHFLQTPTRWSPNLQGTMRDLQGV